MSNQGDEIEEVKTITTHQLASIIWPFRTPKDASFTNEITTYITHKFHEPANKFTKEINKFSNLRNAAISFTSDHSFRDISSLKNLKIYYCQLSSVLSRFRDCGAKFTWKDSLGWESIEGNLDFELNNIIYNIASVHNELGAKMVRNNEATTKEACSHFSSALWWVIELRDNRTTSKPKEMSLDLLTFYQRVLRAQAQECVLFHSIRSGMKPENVAKIAAQIASDYETSIVLAQTPLYSDPIKEKLMGGSTLQTWKVTVEFKYNYFLAITHLLSALANRDDDPKEIGVRIARLKFASQTIQSCKKMISDTIDNQTTKQAYEILDALITKKLDKAIRYNDNVYHSSIPDRLTLPQIEAKLLISPAQFSISSIPEFKDLFSSLVTIEAVQVNSIYSQKKDELSRQMRKEVEKQDEELAQMMSTLNFDKKTLKMPSLEAPNELMEICAELSMNPNIVDDVLTKLEDLDDKSEQIQKMLDGAQALLKQRPNRQFEDELRRFRSTHEDALRTTQSLHKQLYPELQQKIQQLATTDNPTELLPKLNSESKSANDDEVVKKLEKLLDKVDEMKQQRARLVAQLKQSLEEDDVIKHVVAASSETELKNVFDSEIKKHNKYVNPLMSNLKLQDEMLDTLERVNAQYGQVKLNHRAQQTSYVEKFEALKRMHLQFKAVSEGIDQGLDYHKKMVELVGKFCAKVQTSHNLNDFLN